MSWKLWISVPVVYAVFSLWYFNWQGPVTPEELETFMLAFDEAEGSVHTNKASFRKFLEEDDGKEFVMLNQVHLHDGEMMHPVTGEMVSASELLGGYIEPFMLSLFKRGGHPVFQARTVGGNIDSWNAEDNLPFATTAMMRYKSRRDIAELALDPSFADSHVYKLSAIDRTVSYPTEVVLSTSLRPPVAVLLILILLAAMAQNLIFVTNRMENKS